MFPFPRATCPAACASGIAFIVVSACTVDAMAIFARFAHASGANVTGIFAALNHACAVLLARSGNRG